MQLEPDIEVEYMTAALDLAARGRRRHDRHALDHHLARGSPGACPSAPFDPPLFETFAFITRRNAHLSPATRAFMEVARQARRTAAPRLAAEEATEVAARA